MARIIPKAGSVFSPRTPGVQLFRPGRAPAPKSKAQEASEILGIINQGIAAGRQIYGLGSAIAEDLAPTEAELLAERQGEMASRGMAEADARREAARQKLGIGSVEGAQQARQDAIARMQARDPDGRAGYTEPPTMESVAPPGHPLRWPDTPQTQAPETMQITIPEGTRGAPAVRTSIAEELRRRGFEGTDAELREKARQLIYGPGGAGKQTRPGVEYEFEIPKGWSLIKAVAETPSTPLEQKRVPSKAEAARMVANAQRLDPTGQMAKRLQASILEVLQRDGRMVLNGPQQAAVEALAIQRASEAAATQAARSPSRPVMSSSELLASGSDFALSDLSYQYGANRLAGNFDEADKLLGLARLAVDYPALLRTSGQHEVVVDSAARKIIKAGATPEAVSSPKQPTLNEIIKIIELGGKRRRGASGGGGGGGGGRAAAPDDDKSMGKWRQAHRLVGVDVGPEGKKKWKVTSTEKSNFAAQVRANVYGPAEEVLDRIERETGLNLRTYGLKEVDSRSDEISSKAAVDNLKKFETSIANESKKRRAEVGKIRAALSGLNTIPGFQDLVKNIRTLSTADPEKLNHASVAAYVRSVRTQNTQPRAGKRAIDTEDRKRRERHLETLLSASRKIEASKKGGEAIAKRQGEGFF